LEFVQFSESCRGEIRFSHRNRRRSVFDGLASFFAKFPELGNFFFLGVFFFLITLGVFALICLDLAVYFGCIPLLRSSILGACYESDGQGQQTCNGKEPSHIISPATLNGEARVGQLLLLFVAREQTTKNRLTSLLLRLHYKILVSILALIGCRSRDKSGSQVGLTV
jgi:hypothetical protein